MLATSAISMGYSLKALSERLCARKLCTACPPSCTMVVTSSICPAAFIKIKGAPLSGKGQLYPPGALPLRLSRSKCPIFCMVRKQSAKNGFSFSKQAMLFCNNSSPVAKGFSGAIPSGSASRSHGRSVATPRALRLCS